MTRHSHHINLHFKFTSILPFNGSEYFYKCFINLNVNVTLQGLIEIGIVVQNFMKEKEID